MGHLVIMKEFAGIIRGEHPAWRGDKRYNAGFYLRTMYNDDPEFAKTLAFDIECNLEDYSEKRGYRIVP